MSEFQIAVAGSDETYACAPDDTLLRAGLRAGLGLPYECSVGSCGTCKFELVEGEVEVVWPEAPGLTERDKRKERKLACQCRPRSDCVVKLRTGRDYVPPVAPARRQVIFQGAAPVTHDMWEFRFRGDGPAEFLPGQYGLLSLPEVTGVRAFSMANTPNPDGEWHFQIKRVPGGAGSRALFDGVLRAGDAVTLDGPYGLAYLRPAPRDIVCVAGGSGLSPMVSIARGVCADSNFDGRKLHFFYGGRAPRDICGEAFLRDLPGFGERILYHASVSEAEAAAEQGWPGHVGFVHELVEQTFGGTLAQFEHYFAGPPAMAEAVQRMLMLDHKVPFEQIHYDRFF